MKTLCILWVQILHGLHDYEAWLTAPQVSINAEGRYNVPLDPKGGYSIEMYEKSIEEFTFPTGSYWKAAAEGKAPPPSHRGIDGQGGH
jgi:hypothetical protein